MSISYLNENVSISRLLPFSYLQGYFQYTFVSAVVATRSGSSCKKKQGEKRESAGVVASTFTLSTSLRTPLARVSEPWPRPLSPRYARLHSLSCGPHVALFVNAVVIALSHCVRAQILESQLGKYVDGLSSDSLQVGIWSGELVLQNLSLKPHALAELELPVTVIKGTIRRIHIVVPWNQLGSASVQISIEGIYALVVPNTKLPTPDEMQQSKANQIERQELVRQHNRFAEQNNHGGEDESTFISRLTERIVDNLQVRRAFLL